jgi:uncharacterized protein YjbJ (UPF0337 family)
MQGGRSDEAKGRVKQAAGVRSGDKGLEREGQVDQCVGKVEQAIDHVKDALS